MPKITLDLLRKRAEHNEGMISTLEEISLHQEEIEKIEVIGTLCRKLQILYLQNNIIEKIEDLTHMKELKYLNLALNNISRIEGLQSCEFLSKLDLTVNFIDFDTLEESIDHLKQLSHLQELFMMGNPCQVNWEKFNSYVIASLPQLRMLDGKDITRTDRILALQEFNSLQKELRDLAEKIRVKKMEESDKSTNDVIEIVAGKATDISENEVLVEEVDEIDSKAEEKVPYTASSRREMYMELAEQKAEQERKQKENMPKERDYEEEHRQAIEKAKRKEQGKIMQCNEGQWDFMIDDEEDPEFVSVEVFLPKHLDSSLIHVDAHPTYISFVIKNKVLRLRLPEECNSDAGKAQRSKITGALKVSLPKSDSESVRRAKLRKSLREDRKKTEPGVSKNIKQKLGEEMVKASQAVNIKNIVKKGKMESEASLKFEEIRTKFSDGTCVSKRSELQPEECPEDSYDDEPPPLM